MFRSLTGQLALAAAVALLLAQVLTVVLLTRAETRALTARAEAAAAQRLAEAYELHAARDGPLGRRLQRRLARRGVATITDEPLAGEGWSSTEGVEALEARGFVVEIVIARRDAGPRGRPAIVLSAPIDGRWLNVRAPLPPPRPGGRGLLLAQTGLTFLLLLGAVLLVARRASRPLAALTEATRRYRIGGPTPPLPTGGPEDVRALTEAFAALTERTRTLLAERDGLLGAIGHDLRTPITSLRLRAEQIEDEALRAKMIASLRDTERLLEDVLTLARTGRPDGAPELADLDALAREAVARAQEAGRAITLGETATVTGPVHRAAVLRALGNLIDNADRYGGGGTLRLATDGDDAVFEVADRGPGLPPGALRAAFVRGEASRGAATGGSGLGLAIADGVARLHGGRLDLANRPGGGARASLRLPLRPAASS